MTQADYDYDIAVMRYKKLFWPRTYQYRHGINLRKFHRIIRKAMPIFKKSFYEPLPLFNLLLKKGASHAR